MRLKEQKLWDTLKRNAPKSVWLQRVENALGDGMPDVYAGSCWIELKAPTRPRRETTRLLGPEGLRPSQINWHLKAVTKNVSSFILIRDDENQLYVAPGQDAGRINEVTLHGMLCLYAMENWTEVFYAMGMKS